MLPASKPGHNGSQPGAEGRRRPREGPGTVGKGGNAPLLPFRINVADLSAGVHTCAVATRSQHRALPPDAATQKGGRERCTCTTELP